MVSPFNIEALSMTFPARQASPSYPSTSRVPAHGVNAITRPRRRTIEQKSAPPVPHTIKPVLDLARELIGDHKNLEVEARMLILKISRSGTYDRDSKEFKLVGMAGADFWSGRETYFTELLNRKPADMLDLQPMAAGHLGQADVLREQIARALRPPRAD